jgi:uncharacterized protein (DUF1697 family)
MIKYISLLRGINVSGQKKIKMTELKELYESLKFSNVNTYIQSGNVVFCSNEKDVKKIQKQIEQKIDAVYNFSVPIIILTANKLKKIISDLPLKSTNIDLSKLAVTFLDSTPDKTLVKNLDIFKGDQEKFILSGGVLYLYCPDGFGRTKLTNNLFENKLKVTATSRNWKTTIKLFEMINELDCGNNPN